MIRRGAIVVHVTPKETTGTLSCPQLATLRRREGRERERREREERERRERERERRERERQATRLLRLYLMHKQQRQRVHIARVCVHARIKPGGSLKEQFCRIGDESPG